MVKSVVNEIPEIKSVELGDSAFVGVLSILQPALNIIQILASYNRLLSKHSLHINGDILSEFKGYRIYPPPHIKRSTRGRHKCQTQKQERWGRKQKG